MVDLTKITREYKTKIGPRNDGDSKKETLIRNARDESLSLLKRAHCEDIREYAKVWVWSANELKKLWAIELDQHRNEGWQVAVLTEDDVDWFDGGAKGYKGFKPGMKARAWCGVPYETFEIWRYI
jgi:hypothetical protein